MTKIEEILEKYKSKTDHYADQDWYDENVEKALIEYANFCVNEAKYSFKEELLKISVENAVLEKIIEELRNLRNEYAEHYAKKCLEICAENAKLSVGTWVHPKGYPYLMVNQNPYRMEGEDYFYTDQKSITNIQLPEHDR